jgi:hypothetical protein
VKLGGHWHFSHPTHDRIHKIKIRTVEGLFFYTGPHGTGALQNLRTTHRWAHKHHDEDGTTVCNPRLQKLSSFNFHYQNLPMERTVVDGPMTNENIRQACDRKGMAPVCDHSHYNDGKCRAFGNWHFSYPPHARRRGIDHKKLTGAFFYTGPHGHGALQNTGSSHRWRSKHDGHMDTFCTAKPPKPPSFSYLAYNMTRVQVSGVMNAKNIYTACKKKKLAPLCDHVHYYDGKCVAANAGSSWHFSYPHHDRQHGIYWKTLQNSFFYTGIHHTGSLLNTGHSHRWRNHHDKNKHAYCTDPPDEWKEMTFRKHKLFRVAVSGRINRVSILKACRSAGLLPVCDHDHYYDGYCVKRGGRWHFSYPRHAKNKGVELEKIQGMFFYTGPHGSGALQNIIRTHRWSHPRNHDGFTMCAKRERTLKDFDFRWKGLDFKRVMVPGVMTANNILQACHAKGLGPVLDHWHYNDGKARGFGNWHMSHPSHDRHYKIPVKKVIGAFFYTANHHTGSLQNTGRGHRWRSHKDGYMDTFCTKKPPKGPDFSYGRYKMVRTGVHGPMSAEQIRMSCNSKGKGWEPVCDHTHYYDGKCVPAGGRWHFSYPNHVRRHGIFWGLLKNSFFYTGFHHTGSLKMTHNRHRWRNRHDMNGNTYCAKLPKIGPLKYKGKHLHRVKVKGKINRQSILKACLDANKDWLPVCDHSHYYDGYCERVGGRWHFSYPHHDRQRGIPLLKVQGVFFYTGRHGPGALQNILRTHRWVHHRMRDGITMCVKRSKTRESYNFKYQGMDFVRTRVKGTMDARNIRKACAAKGLGPVVDHWHYNDGLGRAFGGWHFSHPHHDRRHGVDVRKVVGAFFYTGEHHTGSLQNTGHSHRWRHSRDGEMDTFCTKKPPKGPNFAYGNFQCIQTKVKGQPTAANIFKACQEDGLFPVCDHSHYFDGKCIMVGGAWHFSHPSHDRWKGIPVPFVLKSFFYTGPHGHGSLLNTGSTHRWRNGNDRNVNTFCTSTLPFLWLCSA